MTRLMEEVKAVEIPIEINLLGLHDGRNYPSERFFKLAAGFELPVVLGCDAHSPNRVCDKNEILLAKRFADRVGIRLVDVVPIIAPFR